MVDFKRIFGRPFPNKTCLIGEGSSGKTCLVNRILKNIFVETTPTTGQNTIKLNIAGKKVILHDIGGQSQYQKLREEELTKKTENILLVIDCNDQSMIEPLRNELKLYIDFINKHSIKVLVIFTKVDLILDSIEKIRNKQEILSQIEEKFSNGLHLYSIKNYETVFTSAKTEFGLYHFYLKYNNMINRNINEKMKSYLQDFQVYNKIEPIRKDVHKIFSHEAIMKEISNFITSSSQKVQLLDLGKDEKIVLLQKSNPFILAGLSIIDHKDYALNFLDEIAENILQKQDLAEIEYYLEHYASNLEG